MKNFLIKIYQQVFLIITIFLFLTTFIIWINPVMAENITNNILKQQTKEISVTLGNKEEELKFVPNQIELENGKRYNLILTNPSSQKHYFTAKDFTDAIWTQKVQVGAVEIKGNIRELELKPGGKAEWVFVALKSGKYSLRCIIPGHTEAGMTGEIVIK